MYRKLFFITMPFLLCTYTIANANIGPDDIELEYASGGVRNDIADLMGGRHGVRVNSDGHFEFFNEKPYAITAGISIKNSDGTTEHRRIVIPPRTSGPMATAVDTVFRKPGNILSYLTGDLGRSTVTVSDVDPREVDSVVYQAGTEEAQRVNIAYGLASFIETTASLLLETGPENAILKDLINLAIEEAVSADNVAAVLSAINNDGCSSVSACKDIFADIVVKSFKSVLEKQAYRSVLIETLARSGLSPENSASVLNNISGKAVFTKKLEFLARMETYGDIASLISATVRFRGDPVLIGVHNVSVKDSGAISDTSPVTGEGALLQPIDPITSPQCDGTVTDCFSNLFPPSSTIELPQFTPPPPPRPIFNAHGGIAAVAGNANSTFALTSSASGTRSSDGVRLLSDDGNFDIQMFGLFPQKEYLSYAAGRAFGRLITDPNTGEAHTYQHHWWVMGEPTTDYLINRSGSASWAGSIFGDYAVRETGTVYHNAVSGDISLKADFSTGSVVGEFFPEIRFQPTSGESRTILHLMVLSGDIDLGRINVDVRDLLGSEPIGEVSALLFGPRAIEIGGTFWFSNFEGQAAGIVVGEESEWRPRFSFHDDDVSVGENGEASGNPGVGSGPGESPASGGSPSMGGTIGGESGVGGGLSGREGSPSGSGGFDASGAFSYTDWGTWNSAIDPAALADGRNVVRMGENWLAYEPTANLPASGSASYQGSVTGAGDGMAGGRVTGDISLNADFGNDRVTGSMGLRDGTDASWADAAFNAPISRGGDNPNSFQGDLTGADVSGGNIFGGFAGPNAEEVGGGWQLEHIDGSGASGIFRAQQ